jgi:hypothetical protein
MAVDAEAISHCSNDLYLFPFWCSFGPLAMESEITDLPVSFVNDTTPCNSTKVSNEVSRKRPNSVVFGNCPVKKRSRILSPIAESAVVPTPRIPIMDSGNSIYSFLRSIHADHCEQSAPVCSSKCSSSKAVEIKGHEPD